jgi:hypothetical protein
MGNTNQEQAHTHFESTAIKASQQPASDDYATASFALSTEKWKLQKEKILFFFLLVFLPFASAIEGLVILYSQSPWVRGGAASMMFTIVYRCMNHLLPKAKKQSPLDLLIRILRLTVRALRIAAKRPTFDQVRRIGVEGAVLEQDNRLNEASLV